jgi:hypothetical protein
MKNAVFWDVTLCGSCKNWRFWGTYYCWLSAPRNRMQISTVPTCLNSSATVEKLSWTEVRFLFYCRVWLCILTPGGTVICSVSVRVHLLPRESTLLKMDGISFRVDLSRRKKKQTPWTFSPFYVSTFVQQSSETIKEFGRRSGAAVDLFLTLDSTFGVRTSIKLTVTFCEINIYALT